MKKIINLVPFVTITIAVICYVGIGQQGWTNVPNNIGMDNILSMFGHGSMKHYLNNMIGLALFGIPAEMLLGKRRYIMYMLITMVVYLCLDVMFVDIWAKGFSGMVYAIPGMFAYGVIRKANATKEGAWCHALIPMMFPILFTMDEVKKIGVNDGISHLGHIIGAIIMGFWLIASIPMMVKVVRRQWITSSLGGDMDYRKRQALRAKLASI